MFASLFLTFSALTIGSEAHNLRKFENFVTFGDSYTDESRLGYFWSHGHGPPPGELTPPSNQTSVGGYSWGRVVANLTGAKYYDYAVAGAMCANNVTSHWFDPIKGPMPSILDYEVPAFEADLAFPKLYPDRHADNTVYAVWIGTNDLGVDGFLTDRNVAGTSLPSFVDCVWTTFDRIYQTGGRQFVLLNTVPLEKSPMYASPENGGTADNEYWGSKSQYNMTEVQYKMLEYTSSANALFEQGLPFHLLVKKRWPQVSFSLFDVHSLVLDIHVAPERYLTQPSNVTWPWKSCSPSTGCQQSNLPMSNFLWYDEVHPSARTSEIVAEEFIKVVNGTSKYGTTYKS
ncbi:hypothetical protein PWT90_01487 [Aphanocladium album]|nr:hypothetical protein PWT90_01487 [Aphanocladium album]